MKLLRGISRALAALAGGVFALLLGVYLTALAMNRHDRAPSAEVRAMAALLDELPEVADEDNGYVYLLGFGAPRGTDPWQTGAERADRIRAMRASYDSSRQDDPHSEALDLGPPPGADASAWREACYRAERQCFEALTAAPGASIADWLEERDWALARYERLLSYSRWRDIETYDSRGPFARHNDAYRAQRIWFIDAWRRAGEGDVAGVRERLRADLELWRLALAESSTYLSKLLAAGLVQRHFEWANIVLKRLPSDSVLAAVPDSWRTSMTRAERSMRRALSGELRFVRNTMEAMDAGRGAYPSPEGVDGSPGWMTRLEQQMWRALLQPGDFTNKRARQFRGYIDAADAPYERFADALEQARVSAVGHARAAGWQDALYNVVGDHLLRLDDGALGVYANGTARAGDLEGVRRAALLAAELRSRRVVPAQVARELARAALRDPYTGDPLRWDAASGAIVFVGLARSNAGRYAMRY